MSEIPFKDLMIKLSIIILIFVVVLIGIALFIIIDPFREKFKDESYRQSPSEFSNYLVDSFSIKLPINLYAGKILKVEKFEENLIFEASIDNNESYHIFEKSISDFICNNREIRVAIYNGVNSIIKYGELTTINSRKLILDEAKCHSIYGSMINYLDFEIDNIVNSNNYKEGKNNPKIAAYFYLGFLKQAKASHIDMNCSLMKSKDINNKKFAFNWSLLTMRLPPADNKVDYFISKTKAELKTKYTYTIDSTTSKMVKALIEIAEKLPMNDHEICNRLQTGYQNIIERQLGTLISCVQGLCIYEGGSSKSTSIAFSGANNDLYRDGHPIMSMVIFAFAVDGINAMNVNPKCEGKKFEKPDYFLFVTKFNEIYGLKPPLNNIDALSKINEIKASSIENNINGKKIVDDLFDKLHNIFKTNNKDFCDSMHRTYLSIARSQYDDLDRCLKGSCKNNHIP